MNLKSHCGSIWPYSIAHLPPHMWTPWFLYGFWAWDFEITTSYNKHLLKRQFFDKSSWSCQGADNVYSMDLFSMDSEVAFRSITFFLSTFSDLVVCAHHQTRHTATHLGMTNIQMHLIIIIFRREACTMPTIVFLFCSSMCCLLWFIHQNGERL